MESGDGEGRHLFGDGGDGMRAVGAVPVRGPVQRAQEGARGDGVDITTVEGLATDGRLHTLQDAFADLGAAQCGYCTPGFLVTAKALLDEHPHPTRDQIKEALSGNLCRCTGYQQIFEAVEAAIATSPQPPAPSPRR